MGVDTSKLRDCAEDKHRCGLAYCVTCGSLLTAESEIAAAHRAASAARQEAAQYQGALRSVLDHVLQDPCSDLRIAKFVQAVLNARGAPPEFFELLREPAKK